MDGVVDQQDLTLLQNYLKSSQDYPLSAVQLALADVNKDGHIDGGDTLQLSKYVNGVIDSFEWLLAKNI